MSEHLTASMLDNALLHLGNLNSKQRELVKVAFQIYQADHGAINEAHADTLLRGLEKQKLITSYGRKEVMKELYA